MSRTSQGTATQGILVLALSFTVFVSHFIVFPLAAWNHNLVLLVLSVIIPAVFARVILATTSIKATGTKKSVSTRVVGIMATVLTGFLFWNHLWYVVVALVVINMVWNKKKRK